MDLVCTPSRGLHKTTVSEYDALLSGFPSVYSAALLKESTLQHRNIKAVHLNMDSIIAAKLVSISSAFILSGYMLSPSQNTLPLLYPQPASVSTVLFRGVFNRGAALVIPVTGLSVAASAYLAYTAPTGSTERTLWAVSGAVTFAMLPMTQVVMMPGIHRLMDLSSGEASAQQKAAASGELLKLLKAWAAQNWVRVAMSGAGGLLGLYAMHLKEL
ncbi:hypothetical protein LTS09_001388 [Friedmanniomyces endolithicus]|nr:hypothetical protein LTS09_001388 [Friedmanniomyces endolithicus]